MVDAFDGTHIVLLSFDEWQARLKGTGFSLLGLPTFFRLDRRGRPLDSLAGNAWSANTPENMSGPLKRFFQLTA